MKDQAAEATVAAVAQKLSFAGSGAAVGGWLTTNEIAAFGGLLIAVVGLVVQWHYKRKEDRRNEALHLARMSEIGEE